MTSNADTTPEGRTEPGSSTTGATTLAETLLTALDSAGTSTVIEAGRHETGERLARRIRATAAALREAGVGEGMPVALFGRPGVDTFVAFVALRLRGAVVVLPDPAAAPSVTVERLRSAGVRLVLLSPLAVGAATVLRGAARSRGIHLPSLRELASVRDEVRFGALGAAVPGFTTAIRRLSVDQEGPTGFGGGDAVVIPTSGTTGAPRSVVHTEGSLANGMEAVGALVGVRRGERVLCGTFFAMIPAIIAGAVVVIPSKRRSRRIGQPRNCSVVYLTPPELRALLAAGARFDGARVYCGSAPVSHRLLGQLRHAGASAASGVYALTEIIPVAVVTAEEKTAWMAAHRGDLLGHLVPGVSARVEDGRLLLQGAAMADRYLGGDALGWIDTGDCVEIDPDAGVVLVGRHKEMILRRAQNIYPGLYEPAMLCNGISTAILVGVPNGDGEEAMVAFVEADSDADTGELLAGLTEVYATWGEHRPDATVFGQLPRSGRSSKPDRRAAVETIQRARSGVSVPGLTMITHVR